MFLSLLKIKTVISIYTINQPVTLKEGYTSKENKDDHGIGLAIINEIVNEYHGINQYQQIDQYLVNGIILFDVIH